MLEQDVQILAATLGVEVRSLVGKARPAGLAEKRSIAYRLLLERGYSGVAVAAYFNRDHSTVYQMRDRITARAVTDTRIRALTQAGRQALDLRPCRRCGKHKPGSEYYKGAPTTCKACRRAASRASHARVKAADPEAYKARRRKYMADYRKRKRGAHAAVIPQARAAAIPEAGPRPGPAPGPHLPAQAQV